MGSTRRSPGTARNTVAVATLPRRDRLLIQACVAGIVLLAWAYLLHLDRQMSSSMTYDTMMEQMGMSTIRPWGPADLFFTFLMWTIMMVGMMAGSAMPVLLLFASARARLEPAVRSSVLLFGSGYLATWAGFSACAALAQWALHKASLLSPAMAASNPRLAGAILIAAGVYQLTPIKGSCLTQCRSPLGFLMTNWRDGRLGALRMGMRHGTYCLGCCWALMCVLFAVGVMNLIWVAALTVFVLAEKIGPGGTLLPRAAGAVMIVAGLLFAAGLA
jgi:predicted metal-binding membrane protein